KMFAGKTTLNVLSKLGMKEGDAIQHPMLSKAVGRAQRKVEERNFLIRKNILEYDEVMDHQRHEFYGMRQNVLEGRNVKELIFEHIDEAVQDAVYTYLDPNYVPNCIAEWIRTNLSISIDSDRIKGKDRDDLHKLIGVDAKEEAANMIRVILGEYMAEELDSSEWDHKGLADWGNSNFKAGLKVSELRDLSRREIIARLEEAAEKVIDGTDLAPLDQYLVPNYGAKELAKWASNKFLSEFKAEEFVISDPTEAMEKATDLLMKRARETYRRREITYPIDFLMDMTNAGLQENPQAALEQFCAWVRMKYELDWSPQALPSPNPAELHRMLVQEAEKWDEDRIAERAEKALVAGSEPEQIEKWLAENCSIQLTEEERKRAEDDPKAVVEEKIAFMLRAEITQFERWVLLQIVDQAWKDHLYAVDQLRESIGLRSFSQLDPRIEFKREGARLFEEMHQSIRDKVTDLIFKAKLTPQVRRPPQAPPSETSTSSGGAAQPVAAGAGRRRPAQAARPATAAAAAAGIGTEAQRRDLEAAERAGSGGAKPKRKPIRAAATVGRNEPCPCGSGKKYKQCCGKRK
ncbi:MAG: SEC-C domain-containing protein, partial [Phycisphaerales bacterium]